MANEIIEGFDHYNTAALLALKGWTVGGTPTLATASPRFSGGQYLAATGTASIQKGVTAHATYTIGAAVYFTSLQNNPFFQLLDSGTIQTDLRLNTSGQLLVTRNGTTIKGPSTETFLINVWYYIEFQVTIDDASGAVTTKVNGTTISGCTGTGLDTKQTANASANQVKILGTGGASGANYDDVYANSGAAGGGANDATFWGDIRVATLYPSGAGSTTQWTPSTGSNYDCVNENPPNTTDYVSSSTANQIDTYAMDDLSAGVGSILGVQVTTYDSKDDAGSRTVQHALRTAATNYFGSTFSLLDSWAFHSTRWALNPNTSAAWDATAVNGLEAGVKLIS